MRCCGTLIPFVLLFSVLRLSRSYATDILRMNRLAITRKATPSLTACHAMKKRRQDELKKRMEEAEERGVERRGETYNSF